MEERTFKKVEYDPTWWCDRKWVKYLDPEKINLLPLQFANADRLRYNDVVYLFDEVGCGKTISAGILTLDYLEQTQKKKKVLVVTENSLAGANGQFALDWLNRLPFSALGYTYGDSFEVRSNMVKSGKGLQRADDTKDGEYGLIIVDEAHGYFDPNALKRKALKSYRAEKLVFMSATPVRNSILELGEGGPYYDIARAVLGRGVFPKALDGFPDVKDQSGGKSLICAQFDPRNAVTRYFKDTARYLERVERPDKRVRRCIPVTEEYESNSRKTDAMWVYIDETLKDHPDSRFVVFVRRIRDEMNVIASFLKDKGMHDCTYDRRDVGNSFARLCGETNQPGFLEWLARPQGRELPRILIANAQVAEAGINLPGFDHIINYHIPGDNVALEQRFGRIDRMNSRYDKIYACYLLAKGIPDTSTENYQMAMWSFKNSVLPKIPSKNTIISDQKEIMRERKEHYGALIKALDKAKDDLLNEPELLQLVIEYYRKGADARKQYSLADSLPEDCDNREEKSDLLEQVQGVWLGHIFQISTADDEETSRKAIEDQLGKRRKSYERRMEEVDPQSPGAKQFAEVLKTVEYKIFYAPEKESWGDPKSLLIVDPVKDEEHPDEGCATWIQASPIYQAFRSEFEKATQFAVTYRKYEKALERAHFERRFHEESVPSAGEPLARSVVEAAQRDYAEIGDDERKTLLEDGNWKYLLARLRNSLRCSEAELDRLLKKENV